MARPNRPRTLDVEQGLARRVEEERLKRGFTYDALAARMTELGCAIQPSALQKIEKSGRRIVVDEAVALAMVFRIPLNEWLMSPEERAEAEGWSAFVAAGEALNDARYAWATYLDLIEEVRVQATASDALRKRIDEYREAARAKIAGELREQAILDEERFPAAGAAFDSWVEENATPAMVAARDALSSAPIDDRVWIAWSDATSEDRGSNG